MPASTTAIVAQRPTNLPVMNAPRPTGLEKSTNTVRFSTSLCTRPAATNTATMSPKKVTATRPKSFIMRPCSPRLMLPSQRPPTIMRRAKTTMTREHAVADRLLERVEGDGDELLHAVDHLHEEVLERGRLGQGLVDGALPDDAPGRA